MAIELTTVTETPTTGLDWEETTYHGKPVGDIFMDEGDEGNCQHLYDLMEQEHEADGFVQDCYLGYVPGRDIFIVGYDLNRGGGYHRVKTTPEAQP